MQTQVVRHCACKTRPGAEHAKDVNDNVAQEDERDDAEGVSLDNPEPLRDNGVLLPNAKVLRPGSFSAQERLDEGEALGLAVARKG